jgi:hypothetical protein
MVEVPTLMNTIHPARPSGVSRPCPFCDRRDAAGLKRLLRWIEATPSTRPEEIELYSEVTA